MTAAIAARAGLRLSSSLGLPLEVAGEALALLGKRGSGKTNTAIVLVEELHGANVQVVVLDPVGVWWGIRAGADGGRRGGLSIPILGGSHGDVALEPAAGELIADVVVSSGQSVVVDVSEFSKTQQRTFVAAFATKLYRAKASARSLLHVVLEEADEFAPQRVTAGDAQMVGAISTLIKRGRSRGIGMTVITQRSASLNKDVLDQADVLISMRTTGPRDRKAIEGWIEHQDAEGSENVLPSLPNLQTGECWVWNPERSLLERVKVRKRTTFDASDTPVPGAPRAEPRETAAIDLELLGRRIAETAERAKENDPAELHRRIRAFESKIAKIENSRVGEPQVVEKIVEKIVEVPMLSPDDRALLEACRDAAVTITDFAQQLEKVASDVLYKSAEVERPIGKPDPMIERILDNHRSPVEPRRQNPVSDTALSKGEMTVLGVLAEFPEGKTQNEVAFLAGYSANASTIGVILSKLRKAGLVEPGQPIRATAEGLVAVGGPVERPRGQALLDHWLQHPRMGEGMRSVFTTLVELYPRVPSNEELCELTGYSPTASTMGVILSKLRKLGLVERGARRVSPELMDAIEPTRVGGT